MDTTCNHLVCFPFVGKFCPSLGEVNTRKHADLVAQVSRSFRLQFWIQVGTNSHKPSSLAFVGSETYSGGFFAGCSEYSAWRSSEDLVRGCDLGSDG